LCTRGDLRAAVNEVVALRERRIVLVPHVVKRANRPGVDGKEYEVVTELLLHVCRNLALALRIHIVVSAGYLVAALLHDLLRLGERNPWEWARGNLELQAEVLLDVSAVLLDHRRQPRHEELLLEIHDIFVGLDPAELGIDRRELRRVP